MTGKNDSDAIEVARLWLNTENQSAKRDAQRGDVVIDREADHKVEARPFVDSVRHFQVQASAAHVVQDRFKGKMIAVEVNAAYTHRKRKGSSGRVTPILAIRQSLEGKGRLARNTKRFNWL
jgi:hypothetical protein